jgi:aminotransferase
MSPIHFNARLSQIPEGVLHKYLELATDPSILSLSVGEPDFPTPFHIRQAAIDAIQAGKTFYTPSKGLLSLRKEISAILSRKHHLDYDPLTDILVTIGASEALEASFITLLNPGDEVILITPAYITYVPIIVMCGAIPVSITTTADNGFKLTPEALKAAITDKTRVLVLNYPSNPTGGVMSHEDYEAIADILRDKDIAVISDEIYSELTYGVPHASIAQCAGMKEKTVLINGFSKAYAMTGWRLGYVCSTPEIIKNISIYHSNAMLCPQTISQFAGVEALKNGDEDIHHMREEYDMRRRLVIDRLNQMGLPCATPLGAFYAFPDIRSSGLSSMDFCSALLQSKKVAVIPGNAFGSAGEGYVRFSYSYSLQHIQEALDRLEAFMSELKSKK